MKIKNFLTDAKNTLFAICDQLKEHDLSPTWVISSIVVIISLMIRFLFYVFELGKCKYWNISSSAINITENRILSFIYYMFYAILLIIYAFFIYKTLVFDLNKKLKSILSILLVNFSLICLLSSINIFIFESLINSIVASIVIHIFCFTLALFYKHKKRKNRNEKTKIDLINNMFVYFIEYLVISLLIFYAGSNSEKNRKEFRIIDNEYAIVYSNSEHYYLVKYDEKSKDINPLIQKIIKIEDVEFSVVNIEDD